MSFMNRLGVANNAYQQIEKHKRVLTVCSAGCLRSPTAAVVLAGEPYNFNTRAAGCTEEYALIAIDEVLISWADEVVFMEKWQEDEVRKRFRRELSTVVVKVLNIPDQFSYRDPELVDLIKTRYDACE